MTRPSWPGAADDELLSHRAVFLRGPIDEEIADETMSRLLFLQQQDAERDLRLYINSPGGSVTASLAIHDTIEDLTCDVATCVIGEAASTACLLAAAGTKGKRSATTNASFMVHIPFGARAETPADQATVDMVIARLRRDVLEVLQRHTGQAEATLSHEIDVDRFMPANEAQQLGIVDRLLLPRPRAMRPHLDQTTRRPGEASKAPSFLGRLFGRSAARGDRHRNRVVQLFGEIDNAVANETALKLLALERTSAADEVRVEIDSPGGAVTASLMLLDLLGRLTCPVATVATGEALGTACLLLASGDHRSARRDARIGFADVWGGNQGTPTEIEIQDQEISRLKSALSEAFSAHTGRPADEIRNNFGTDVVMAADEARERGLIDEILE